MPKPNKRPLTGRVLTPNALEITESGTETSKRQQKATSQLHSAWRAKKFASFLVLAAFQTCPSLIRFFWLLFFTERLTAAQADFSIVSMFD